MIKKQIGVRNGDIVDLNESILGVDFGEREVLGREGSGKAGVVGFKEELLEREFARKSVVVKEEFNGGRRSSEVRNGVVVDGEDGGVGVGEKEVGGELKEGGDDGESAGSEGGRGV